MEIPRTEGPGKGRTSSNLRGGGGSFMNLILNPREFFNEIKAKKAWPMAWLVLFLFLIAQGISSVDSQLAKFGPDDVAALEFVNTWQAYWGLALSVGLLGGLLTYLFLGWIYNLRIRWSGGKSASKVARKMIIYAGLINSVTVIILTLLETLIQDFPVPAIDAGFSTGDWLLMVLIMITLPITSLYSVYISYRGVIIMTDVVKRKAKFWFLILPMIIMGIVWLVVTSVLFVVVLDSFPF